MTGHESGIDLRRDDGTLDVALNWIARNGEVHFTIEVNSQFGLSKTIVDLTPEESAEIGGAFKAAGRQAGPPYRWGENVKPMSIRELENAAGRNLGTGWTARDVGQVLGERD